MEKRIKKYTLLCVIICFLGIGVIGLNHSNSSLSNNISQVQEKEDSVEIKEEAVEEEEEDVVVESTSPQSTTSQTTQQEKTETNQSAKQSSQKQTTQSDSSQTTVSSNQQTQTEENKTYLVTLTIQGIDSVIGSGEVEFEEGQSVYDVLKTYTDQNGIELKKSGSGTIVYVKGIAGLNEFDYGSQSGWLYKVNDVVPNQGAGSYQVAQGDNIVWYYVCGE